MDDATISEIKEVVNGVLVDFKGELLKTIQEEIVIKVKEEVKSEIITSIVDTIEKSNKEIVQAVKDSNKEIVQAVKSGNEMIRQEMATSSLQTHELLSNIAGVLKSIDRKTK